MKNLMVALTVLFASQGAFAATAHEYADSAILLSSLTAVEIDENHEELAQLSYASVLVNLPEKTVKLLGIYPYPCKEGMMCPAVMLNYERELPIVSRLTNRCGATVYVAKKDMRPVDGPLNELIVVDNTNNICPTFDVLQPTEVTFHTVTSGMGTGGPIEATSRFSGSAFIPASTDAI